MNGQPDSDDLPPTETVAGSNASSSDSSGDSDFTVQQEPLGTLGQYELLHKLGAGGMGSVYKARHEHLETVVAIKVLTKELTGDPRSVARFRREMKAVGKLNHPNIIQALDAGESDGQHFLVMEYVDGIDLGRVIKRKGPLPLSLAAELVRQAAEALEFARQAGWIHRDIKPANLMIAEERTVRVLDFGLARVQAKVVPQEAKQEILTLEDQIIGTPDYMSPEQAARDRDLDIRADIYSLGCTWFALLAGRAPFQDDDHPELVSKIVAHTCEDPPPITNFCADAPPEVCAILDKLMAKEPVDRFAAPGEVVAAIKAIQPKLGPIEWDYLEEFVPGISKAPAGEVTAASTPSQPLVLYLLGGGVLLVIILVLLVMLLNG